MCAKCCTRAELESRLSFLSLAVKCNVCKMLYVRAQLKSISMHNGWFAQFESKMCQINVFFDTPGVPWCVLKVSKSQKCFFLKTSLYKKRIKYLKKFYPSFIGSNISNIFWAIEIYWPLIEELGISCLLLLPNTFWTQSRKPAIVRRGINFKSGRCSLLPVQ